MTKFYDLYMQNKVRIEDLDDFLEEWNRSGFSGKIHEYLGLTEEQYFLWCDDPEKLKRELDMRKKPKGNQRLSGKAGKEEFVIRRFRAGDAEGVQRVIHRGLREVNSKDYPAEKIEAYCRHFTLEKIIGQAESAHMYVAESPGGGILATGSIAPFWGSETESILLTIYVDPDHLGRGIGSAIVAVLEDDEYFLRANRIEVPASTTAVGFYEKMGYACKNGKSTPDGEGLVRMEKSRALRNVDICPECSIRNLIDGGSDSFQM